MKKALKRIGKILIGLLLFIVMFVLFLAFQPDGLPPDESKLLIPVSDIPDSENGFFPAIEAVADINDEKRAELYKANPIYKSDPEEVARLMEDFKDNVILLEKAASLPEFSFRPVEGLILPDAFIETSYDFMNIRYLSMILLASAWHDHINGNTGSALETIFAVMRLGNNMSSSEGILLVNHIGRDIQNQCIVLLDIIIDNKSTSTEHLISATQALDGLSSDNTGIEGSYAGEYYLVKDFMEAPSFNLPFAVKLKKAPEAFFLKKNRVLSLAAEMHMENIENADRNYCDLVDHRCAWGTPDGYKCGISEILRGNYTGYWRIYHAYTSFHGSTASIHESRFMVSALRLKIAILLYIRGGGIFLNSLEELIPDYFDSIEDLPKDPFDGKPLRYIPPYPTIYSVGENCIEDEGFGRVPLGGPPDTSHFSKDPDLKLSFSRSNIYED